MDEELQNAKTWQQNEMQRFGISDEKVFGLLLDIATKMMAATGGLVGYYELQNAFQSNLSIKDLLKKSNNLEKRINKLRKKLEDKE